MIRKLFATFALLIFGGNAMAIEAQKFTVDAKADVYEIRSYPSMIVAQTKVNAGFENAGGLGFRILADYIFGDNTVPVPMQHNASFHPATSPEMRDTVARHSHPKSEKIAMMIPVTMFKTKGGFWVQFIMPEKFSLANLPRPNDSRIKIQQIPARKIAVIQYSGTWTYEKYQEQLNILLAALQRDKVPTIGEPIFAKYNTSFQLWFLRHNEIWLEVQ